MHNNKVAVIGPRAFVLTAAINPGETFDSFTPVAGVRDLFNNIGSYNYKIIPICSDQEEANFQAARLITAVQNEPALWGFAITTHVNRGDGLFWTGHRYAWLARPVPDARRHSDRHRFLVRHA